MVFFLYRKKHEIISGNVFFQDSSISKLTRELEALKKELRERDSMLSAMTTKVNKLKEPKNEERDARERELISLRQVNLGCVLCIGCFNLWL